MTRLQKLKAIKAQMDEANQDLNTEMRHIRMDEFLVAALRALATIGYTTTVESIIESYEVYGKWYA